MMTLLLCLLCALGCSSPFEEALAAPPPSEPPAAEVPLPPAPTATAHHSKTTNHKMHDRFREAFAAHDALLMGDLTSFREQMSQLARDGGVPGKDDKNAAFREVAATAAMAADSEEAALGFARTGAACGACHSTVGHPYRPESTAPPEVEADVISHMTRHFWASERLWEGLVSGDEKTWKAGAMALDEDQLLAVELPPVDGADANMLAAEVHKAGQAAVDATSAEERVAAYARLITACQACHTRLQRPPGTELTP